VSGITRKFLILILSRVLLFYAFLAMVGCCSHKSLSRSTSGCDVCVVSPQWSISLETPYNKRFDASGLARTPDGRMFTINDKEPGLFEVIIDTNKMSGEIRPASFHLNWNELTNSTGLKFSSLDLEGLFIDEFYNVWLSDESHRLIIKGSLTNGSFKILDIDWNGYEKFFSKDLNASFEGIALCADKLFVVNERRVGKVIKIDLQKQKAIYAFSPKPYGSMAADVHYSDISCFKGFLYLLLRESGVVLKVNPNSYRVLAEYNFLNSTQTKENAYRVPFRYRTSLAEGIAVCDDGFFIIIDNNGWGKVKNPEDKRPMLYYFKFNN
jgi:uncharacterized protein YjiK